MVDQSMSSGNGSVTCRSVFDGLEYQLTHPREFAFSTGSPDIKQNDKQFPQSPMRGEKRFYWRQIAD